MGVQFARGDGGVGGGGYGGGGGGDGGVNIHHYKALSVMPKYCPVSRVFM